MLNSYYGGESVYTQQNSYSRYTQQFLHYLFMFSYYPLFGQEDLDLAGKILEMIRKDTL
jgi:hypothetical protein